MSDIQIFTELLPEISLLADDTTGLNHHILNAKIDFAKQRELMRLQNESQQSLQEKQNLLQIEFSKQTSEVQLENQKKIQEIQHQNSIDLSNAQKNNNIELERKRVKMEMIRMAKEIVMENKKLLPIHSKSITPDDLIEFSEKLFEYYNN